jgi:transcriptional regulator with XRE-family HTH domain
MNINTATAKAIDAQRAVANLSLRQFSELCEIPISTAVRILSAKRPIRLDQLEKIANALGLSVLEIVEDAQRILERANRGGYARKFIDEAEAGNYRALNSTKNNVAISEATNNQINISQQ